LKREFGGVWGRGAGVWRVSSGTCSTSRRTSPKSKWSPWPWPWPPPPPWPPLLPWPAMSPCASSSSMASYMERWGGGLGVGGLGSMSVRGRAPGRRARPGRCIAQGPPRESSRAAQGAPEPRLTARAEASWRFLRMRGLGSSIQGTATKATSSSMTCSPDWPGNRKPASSTVPGEPRGRARAGGVGLARWGPAQGRARHHRGARRAGRRRRCALRNPPPPHPVPGTCRS
jgi:hypothetical protein